MKSKSITLLTFFFFATLGIFFFIQKKSFSKIEKHPKEEKNKFLNIIERSRQEFNKTRDPKTKTVPTERLLDAKASIDLMLAQETAISNVNWEERGPNNVGGRTRAILFDASDNTNNTVYAAGVSGGLWKTTTFQNANPTWTVVNDFFQNIAITAIVQDPNNSSNIYFGTGEGFDGQIRGLGIWKTSNGGTSWAQLSSTNNSQFHFIQDLLFDGNGHLYAATLDSDGTNGGIKKSINGGTSWTNVLGTMGADLELGANNDIYATIGFQGYATAGVDGAIHKSDFSTHGTNTGNAGTWTDITPNNTNTTPAISANTYYERIEIATAPNNANRIYALCEGEDSDDVTSIFRSNDGGLNWITLSVPTICDQGDNSPFTRSQAWYDLIAIVSPTNANHLYIGGIDMLRSTNGGSSWTQITDWAENNSGTCGGTQLPPSHADYHEFVFEPGSSTKIIIGNDGGLHHSSNITQTVPPFTNKNQGYRVTQFYSCALHPTAGSNYMLGGTQDNGTPQFNSAGIANTTDVSGGDGGFCHIDQDNPMIQIVTNTNNQFNISTDGGANFSSVELAGGSFINPTDYDNTANLLYANHSSGKYLRWNNPATGGSSNTVVTINGVANIDEITHVSVSPNNANRVYFGDSYGNVFRVDNAHTGSSKTGVRILNPTSVVGASSISVSCIAVETGNENHILVTYSNYGISSVFETTDGGTNWTNIENNLPDMPIRWVIFNPTDSDQAFLATEMGVWSTDNLNGTATDWTVTSSGLANVRVDMLQYRTSDNLIAAATHGRGIFTTIVGSGNNCHATLTLNGDPIASDTYQASNTITSSGTVPAGSTVVMDATNSVTLTPSFKAVLGSDFLAKIGGCTASIVANDDDDFSEIDQLITTKTPTGDENIVLDFSLYPSPASASVTLDLQLNQKSEVVVSLHNSMGKLVRVIQNSLQVDRGNQQLTFDASDLKSGMYYVIVSSPQIRKSQKLMIIRN